MRAAAGAILHDLTQVVEDLHHGIWVHVSQPEAADAGGVDDPAATGKGQGDGLGGGVAALADPGDVPGFPVGVRNQPVDHRGLTHAGVTDQGRDLAGDDLGEICQLVAGAGVVHGHVQVPEFGGEGLRVFQVGLRQAQHGLQATDEGSDQGALDEPGPRWRVGDGGDDQQVLRIRDDDALVGVGVVRGAAQHGVALSLADDACQRVFTAGGIAHHADAVADDDGGAPHLPGEHAGDLHAGLV